MAYKTEELLELALEGIVNQGLITIESVCDYIGVDKKTFYKHNLHEVPEIKEARLLEKRALKKRAYQALVEQMEEDKNTTATLAVIKLCGNQDERDALNGKQTTNVNITTHSDLLDELEK